MAEEHVGPRPAAWTKIFTGFKIALDHLDKPLPEIPEPPIVVPVPGLNLIVIRALAFARSLSQNVIAVHVTDDLESAQRLRLLWDQWAGDVPLVVLESPYRSLVNPLLAYLDALEQQHPGAPVTVADSGPERLGGKGGGRVGTPPYFLAVISEPACSGRESGTGSLPARSCPGPSSSTGCRRWQSQPDHSRRC